MCVIFLQSECLAAASITFDPSSHPKSCHSRLVTESHVPLWKQRRRPRCVILIGAEANWFWVPAKDGTLAERRVGLLAWETSCSRLQQESGVSAKWNWIERELKSRTRKKTKQKTCLPVFPVSIYFKPPKLYDGLRKHLHSKIYE